MASFNAIKRVPYLLQRARNMSTVSKNLAGKELLEAKKAEEAHANETFRLWKKISKFVAFPAILLCVYQAINLEMEHSSHPRADFVPFSHLRFRRAPFPWGDGNHSLFHSDSNALPEGYEA